MEAFDLRGGVPALLEWAGNDPGGFYQLWGRLAPREVNAEITGKDGASLVIRVVRE
jgi:hypothetical protein